MAKDDLSWIILVFILSSQTLQDSAWDMTCRPNMFKGKSVSTCSKWIKKNFKKKPAIAL